VVTLGLFASVYRLYSGPFWPTSPAIYPNGCVDGSSLILPFTVTDRSAVLGMPKVTFRCGIDLVWAVDSKGQTVLLRDFAFESDGYTVPSGSKPLNYDCDASGLLRTNYDGTLSINGYRESPQSDAAHIYHPPWQILKMCVWVGGRYKIAGFWSQEFASGIFQWPATRGSHQWLDGRVIQSAEREDRLPGFVPDAPQCSASVRFPYILVEGPDTMEIVLK
jgi:hypothetical protein